MTTYNVSIPESKNDFFLEFLELIGAEYEQTENDSILSDEIKKMLDDRLKTSKEKYVPARKAIQNVRKKYGL